MEQCVNRFRAGLHQSAPLTGGQGLAIVHYYGVILIRLWVATYK